MIVVTIFLSILDQMEIHSVQNRKDSQSIIRYITCCQYRYHSHLNPLTRKQCYCRISIHYQLRCYRQTFMVDWNLLTKYDFSVKKCHDNYDILKSIIFYILCCLYENQYYSNFKPVLILNDKLIQSVTSSFMNQK